MCYWVLEFDGRQEEYGLRLPGLVIEPDFGEKHYERVLKELALYGQAIPRHIERQATGDQLILASGCAFAAAQHRFDPQHHLTRAERLGDVVVRSQLETDNTIELFTLGGEHDQGDGGGFGIALENPGQLEPVQSWEHEVEDNQVRGGFANGVESGVAAVLDGNVESLLLEVVLEDFGDGGLVFDDEDVCPLHARVEHSTEFSTESVENLEEKAPGIGGKC